MTTQLSKLTTPTKTIMDCLKKINFQESELEIITIYDNYTMCGNKWRLNDGFLYGTKIPHKNNSAKIDSDSEDDDPTIIAVHINEISEIYKDNIKIYCKKNTNSPYP